jgi:fructose-bisphosphate aldolase, class II
MTLATLSDVLCPCLRDRTAVAGFVVLGWEDAVAFVRAAEAEARPVILQAGPGCRAHTPLPVLGTMFRTLAEGASVPVVAHLDHGEGIGVCAQAIDCGFTSVMYDGSALSFAENVRKTAEIVDLAHRHGVSVEAELGYVGYHQGAASRDTDVEEVARFAIETGIDALAVSVGNSHLMDAPGATVDMALLQAMARAAPDLPLVLHGGSGIAPDQRRLIAAQTTVCKFNIGTTLRMVFGAALRDAVNRDHARFDRIAILSETIDPMIAAARAVIRSLGPESG